MKQDLIQLMKRANNLKDQRNLVAHGLWRRMPNERLWKVFKMDALDDGLFPSLALPVLSDTLCLTNSGDRVFQWMQI